MVQMNTMRDLRRVVLLQGGAGRTDGQLLESFINQKDEVAFEALIHRHGPMVLGVCRRILRNHHDAEDAFQATFLVLVGNASSVRPREMVGNWLHGVAYRTALKARTIAAKRKTREKQLMEMPEPEAAPQNPGNELQPLLDRELSCLPVNYRLPVLLCDLEGKTIKEATEQLGWPQGTLAGRLARGRKMLAKRLARRGVALSGGLPAVILVQNVATACVSPSLISSTVKAAALIAAGQVPAVGVVPAKVAVLMEGVKTSMMPTKLKLFTAVLLALGTGAFGSGLLARYSAAQQIKPDKVDKEPANRKAKTPPKSLDEKLYGEWIFKEEQITLCMIFKPDHSLQIISDSDLRFPQPNDVGTYSVDWSKTPYGLNIKLGDLPGGQTIMEFTEAGKLHIEWSAPDDGPPKKFSDKSLVLTKKEKPSGGSKQAAEDAEKDLKIAAFYRRTGKIGSAYFYYELVQNRYPGSAYAKLAKDAISELKKKHVGKLEDGSEVWGASEDAAAAEIYELLQQVQKLESRLKALQERLQSPPKVIPPPPKMIPPPPEVNGAKENPLPPPKVNGDVPVAIQEIEELRQHIKNLEDRLAALEAKGSKKGDTDKSFRVGQIIVVGNTVTRTAVILDQIGLQPGQVLDVQALRTAKKNLAQFNPSIKIIDGDSPELKDILIKVKEK
ncbi:MAG TPA: sigma-70 family RNA polymerase sigma factor [Gemmata sp.]|jgi:RNA polymerase sigma-70 factor (ECF subfamily)|nr:sigma-70 family RNA polymerase sigma factor [Gemmata sp.]